MRENINSTLSYITIYFLIAIILLFLAFLPLFYQYEVYKNNPQILTNNNVIDIVNTIKPFTSNEIPQIILASDFSNQPENEFYNLANIGDLILIYPNAHKVILYRPFINSIIKISDFFPDLNSTTSNNTSIKSRQ